MEPSKQESLKELQDFEDFVEQFRGDKSLSPVSSTMASQLSSGQASILNSPTKKKTKKKDTEKAVIPVSYERKSKLLATKYKYNDEEGTDSEDEAYDTDGYDKRRIKGKKKVGAPAKIRKVKSLDISAFVPSQSLISPQSSDFHRACQFGHISSLESMFRKGEVLDVNSVDHLNNTGLHEATLNGHWEVIRFLIKKGASLDVKNLSGKTPVDISRTPSIAAFLNEFKMRSIIAKDHPTLNFVWSSDISGLREALLNYEGRDKRKSFVNERDDLGYSALHAAAIFDRIDVARLLLDNGAEIDAPSNSGITPLHDACRFSSSDCIKFLLEASADVSKRNKSDHVAFTMANKPNRRLFRRVLKEMGVEEYGFEDTDVIVHFEDVSDQSDSENEDASSSDGLEDELRTLPTRAGGISREERKLQQMLAIMNRLSPAKKEATQKKRGRPPKKSIDFYDDDDAITESESSPERVKVLRTEPKVVRVKKLDPNFRDKSYGTTLLHKLAGKGNLKEVKKLISIKKSLVKVVDNAGYIALHEAALNGHLPIVKVLLDAGSNIDHAALDGDTPLHDASENGHADVVAYLLQAGANRILKNANGETALDVASNARIRAMLEVPAKKPVLKLEERSKSQPIEAESARRGPGRPKKSEKTSAKKISAEKVKKETPVADPVRRISESSSPLLLVRVGEPSGWFFLSPQVESLYLSGYPNSSPSDFRTKYSLLYGHPLSEIQRSHLVNSPLMKRLENLKIVLQDPSVHAFMLEKDSVYSVFNGLGLSFGHINVIYLDLQRVLRSSFVEDPSTSTLIPPKLKMKMQRKGSTSGLPTELAPILENTSIDTTVTANE